MQSIIKKQFVELDGAATPSVASTAPTSLPSTPPSALPRAATIPVGRELRALGCGGAVIYAAGFAETGEGDLQSALLHEFGHWLILAHCADSQAVMFAKLTTGTLKRELQPSDILGIRTIYPE